MKPLSGWKEIAAHLGQGLRTVQRWEALGLPVHRVGGGKRARVVAFPEELEAWEKTAPRRLLDEIAELKNEVKLLKQEVALLTREKARASSQSAA
jgi:phage terminase Nu1 subunit (DNA packaging protein)